MLPASLVPSSVRVKKSRLESSCTHLLCCLISLCLGIQVGINSSFDSQRTVSLYTSSLCGVCPKCGDFSTIDRKPSTKTSFPPPSVQRVFFDYVTTPRKSFLKTLDLGVPTDKTLEGAEDVLLLYNSNRSLPTTLKHEQFHHIKNAAKAVQNCQTVKVVLVDPYNFRVRSPQCLALVPQWSSSYVYKFMRLPEEEVDEDDAARVSDELPLRYVSKTHEDSGYNEAKVPSLNEDTFPSLETLADYIHELPHAQERIRSLLNSANFRDPLVVMTCNEGQSELLINFVCSANHRNLSLSRVILFATDEATYHLCKDLQIPYCYLDQALFGDIPAEAAETFGDATFAEVMKAKVYCVHLIMTLGYSVLFMDVDVIWYKDPLEYYWTVMKKNKWDLVFQDDGARTLRYSPYSPNSGFYFIDNNPQTMFLFGELLKMGDTISAYHSHQHALAQVLNEHVIRTGLRVKVHPFGFGNPFPGGIEFNRRPEYMKDLLKNKATKQDPYIFHMCWTESMVYKKKFYQQIGQWFVQQDYDSGDCKGTDCCVREPEAVCHFRDVPSVHPCNDSPPLDEEDPGDSFWP